MTQENTNCEQADANKARPTAEEMYLDLFGWHMRQRMRGATPIAMRGALAAILDMVEVDWRSQIAFKIRKSCESAQGEKL